MRSPVTPPLHLVGMASDHLPERRKFAARAVITDLGSTPFATIPVPIQRASDMRRIALLALTAPFLLVGCEQLGIADAEPSEFDVPVVVASLADAVASVVCRIEGPGIETPITAQLALTGDSAKGTVTVPAGTDRTFTLEAFDRKGILTHTGAATVDVDESLTGSVAVILEALTESVPIEGRFSEVLVVVEPADNGLTAGDSAQYTVTVTKDGAAVDSPQVVWASSNPSVASVTSGGLVRAKAVGTAEIVANFSGVAGRAALTVSQ